MTNEEQGMRVLAPRAKWWPRVLAFFLLLCSVGLLMFVWWGVNQL